MVGLADTLRRPVVGQLLRFGVVGVANMLVTLLTVWLARNVGGLSVGVASATGYTVGMIQGFVLNRFWTFAGIDHARPAAIQAAGFVAVNLICGTIFTQSNIALSRHLPLLAASAVSIAIVVPLSFTLNRSFVFARAPR